jgi:hypothetical protein
VLQSRFTLRLNPPSLQSYLRVFLKRSLRPLPQEKCLPPEGFLLSRKVLDLVEMARRPVQPVQLVPAPRSLTSAAGSKATPAGSTSPPSKAIPSPERTRSLTAEAVRLPTQYTVSKSPAAVGHTSAAKYTTLTPSGTRSPAASRSSASPGRATRLPDPQLCPFAVGRFLQVAFPLPT